MARCTSLKLKTNLVSASFFVSKGNESNRCDLYVLLHLVLLTLSRYNVLVEGESVHSSREIFFRPVMTPH